MNEPRLKQIEACEFYPAPLKADIAEFNAEIDRLEMSRLALASEAGELRAAAIAGKTDKPERLTVDAGKLVARHAALDVQEIGLLLRKEQFQAPILDARKAERERLDGLIAARKQELTDGLNKMGANLQRCNEVLTGDAQVQSLAVGRNGVSGHLKVVSELDAARLGVLQARVAAAVPVL